MDAVDGPLQVVQLGVQVAGQLVQHALGVEQLDGLRVGVVVHLVRPSDVGRELPVGTRKAWR